MCAIALAHVNTCVNSLMRVKNKTRHFCLWYLWKWMKEQKTSRLIVDHFSLTFANLSLAWMLYFHVWPQWLHNNRKFFVWSEYFDQFGIYEPSCVSLLETRQSNVSNPEACSDSCQTSEMEYLVKISITKRRWLFC